MLVGERETGVGVAQAGVRGVVRRADEDVLAGLFVAAIGEIEGKVGFQHITAGFQFLLTPDHGLPRVLRAAAFRQVELDVLAGFGYLVEHVVEVIHEAAGLQDGLVVVLVVRHVRLRVRERRDQFAVVPVVTDVDRSVRGKLGQHGVADILGHTGVELLTQGLAVGVGKQRNDFQQLVAYEFEHLRALGLLHLAHLKLRGRQNRHAAPVIEGVGVHECAQGADLGDVIFQEFITAVLEHLIQIVNRSVALRHEVEDLAPGGLVHLVGRIIVLDEQVLIVAVVHPVSLAARTDEHVRGQVREAIDITAVSSEIVIVSAVDTQRRIELRDSVQIYQCGIGIGFLHGQAARRILIQEPLAANQSQRKHKSE